MKTVFLLVSATLLLQAQDDRTISFSDDGRPRQVKVDLVNGRITVRGHAGKEALLQIQGRPPQTDRNGGWIRAMRNVSVTEQNNVVTISGGTQRDANITLQVPYQTSLQLHCVNCGDIRVENVQGDMDINNTNGGIHLTNISGSVLAHSLNHNVVAILDKLDPSKTHSFTTMNGTVDVTFPADLKANVKMRTENGKIHTDYDIRLGGGDDHAYRPWNRRLHRRRWTRDRAQVLQRVDLHS